MQFKDVLLRTRRALLLYKLYGDNALVVLNGTSFVSANALLALSRRSVILQLRYGQYSYHATLRNHSYSSFMHYLSLIIFHLNIHVGENELSEEDWSEI